MPSGDSSYRHSTRAPSIGASSVNASRSTSRRASRRTRRAATSGSTGRFAWGVVQHEYAHQVDFILFDDAIRTELLRQLGGTDWCYSVADLPHAAYGCERFASTLAWTYWPSAENCLKPTSMDDESGAMRSSRFKALMRSILRQVDARR